jgi:hypothetical protein
MEERNWDREGNTYFKVSLEGQGLEAQRPGSGEGFVMTECCFIYKMVDMTTVIFTAKGMSQEKKTLMWCLILSLACVLRQEH